MIISIFFTAFSCSPVIRKVIKANKITYENPKKDLAQAIEQVTASTNTTPAVGATLTMPAPVSEQNPRDMITYVKKVDSLNDAIEQLQDKLADIRQTRAFTAKDILPISLDSLEKILSKELYNVYNYRKNFDTPDLHLQRTEQQIKLVKQYLAKVGKGYQVAQGLNIMLIANVFFKSGEHYTNQTNLKELDHTIKEMLKSIDNYRKEHPNELIGLQVAVDGYADKKPFYVGQPTAERQAQNLQMSKLRAQAVADYIYKRLEPLVDNIQHKVAGLGEALPPTLAEDSPNPDPRRRVCVVNLAIFSQ